MRKSHLSRRFLAATLVFLITGVFVTDTPIDITIVQAYTVINQNAVDADSNVDGVSNLGTSSQTYTSAQAQDLSYQNISEAQYEMYSNNRNFRKNITISASSIDTTLTNYPFVLDIYDTDLRTDTLSNGWDIYFESNAEVGLDF